MFSSVFILNPNQNLYIHPPTYRTARNHKNNLFRSFSFRLPISRPKTIFHQRNHLEINFAFQKWGTFSRPYSLVHQKSHLQTLDPVSQKNHSQTLDASLYEKWSPDLKPFFSQRKQSYTVGSFPHSQPFPDLTFFSTRGTISRPKAFFHRKKIPCIWTFLHLRKQLSTLASTTYRPTFYRKVLIFHVDYQGNKSHCKLRLSLINILSRYYCCSIISKCIWHILGSVAQQILASHSTVFSGVAKTFHLIVQLLKVKGYRCVYYNSKATVELEGIKGPQQSNLYLKRLYISSQSHARFLLSSTFLPTWCSFANLL